MRTCLEAFLKRKAELTKPDRDSDISGFARDFWKLREKTLQYRADGTFPTEVGQKDCNIKKNRYKDILPFDATRVKLKERDGKSGSDYINANFVKGVSGKNTYIATQGPQPHTVADFWRMIWENSILIIFMACNEYEGTKHKCQKYWPDPDEELQFHNLNVSLIEEKTDYHADFIVRHLQVTDGSEVRAAYQFHYVAWPDYGTPTSALPILDMIALARQFQSQDLPPLLVHCSAGCGRTGTLIVIDYAWTMLRLGKLTEDFNLYDIIDDMRQQRISLVQSPDQYEFVHNAVAELFQRHLVILREHLYENVTFPNDKMSNDLSVYCDEDVNNEEVFEEPTPLNSPTGEAIMRTMSIFLENEAYVSSGDVSTGTPDQKTPRALPKSPSTCSSESSKSSDSTAEKKKPPPLLSPKPRKEKPVVSAKPLESAASPGSPEDTFIFGVESSRESEAKTPSHIATATVPESVNRTPPPKAPRTFEYDTLKRSKNKLGENELTDQTQSKSMYSYADADDARRGIDKAEGSQAPTVTPVPPARRGHRSTEDSTHDSHTTTGTQAKHPDECAYEEVDSSLPNVAAYAHVVYKDSRVNGRTSSSCEYEFEGGSDDDIPAVPPKSDDAYKMKSPQVAVSTSNTSTLQTGWTGKPGKVLGLFTKGAQPVVAAKYSGEPVQVINKGMDISFPNRVGKVRGPRQNSAGSDSRQGRDK